MKSVIMKWIKTSPFSFVMTVIALALIVFFAIQLKSYQHMKHLKESAATIGATIGSVPGQAVGMAVGSHEGWESGKDDAINHPEVEVEYQQKVCAIGKLEPLKLTVKEDNYQEGQSLRELQIIQAEVIYSIDLTKTDFKEIDSALVVTLPQPEVQVTYKEKETQTMFQSQNSFWFDGASADGWTSGFAAREEIYRKTKLKFENDEDLMQQAKNIGQQEVEKILHNVQLLPQDIKVQYEGEGV